MTALVLVARLVLAAVLGVVAVAKLSDRRSASQGLADFGVPSRVSPLAVPVLALAELGAAGALLPNATARWAAVGAIALLALFSVAVAYQLVRGKRPDCGCFGKFGRSRIGPRTLVRNAALVALAAFVLVAGPGANVATVASRAQTDAIAVGALGAALAFGVANAAFSWQLLKQNGRLWTRLSALEEGSR